MAVPGDKTVAQEDPAGVAADADIFRIVQGGVPKKQTFLAGVKTYVQSWIDATMVAFLQTGAGAVAYTLAKKFYGLADLKDFGVKGDGTDETVAINAAIVAIANAAVGRTIFLTDGDYTHSGMLEWGYNRARVCALGGKVVFHHTGVGRAHSFNGIALYPGSQGAVYGVFGGPGRVILKGNANTTDIAYVNNWHFGYMKVGFTGPGGCTHACLFSEDTGIVGGSAVETVFDIAITQDNLGAAMTTVPWYGVRAEHWASCIIDRIIIEAVGNVANATPGLSLVSCIGNLFKAGTVESCVAGGISIGGTSHRNTFLNIDAEVNGTQQDWIITANNNTFTGCSGGGTTSGQYIAGNNNVFKTCDLQGVIVQPGATENKFDNCSLNVAFVDGGTRTTVISPSGTAGATAQDASISKLLNKVIDAALNTISNITTAMFAANVIDTDGTLAANSDTRIATQKAVKTFAVPNTKLGAANGVATLDGGGKLTAAQIPASLVGAVVYQGTWNATTNSPALVSSTGTKGFYYKVATAGTTSIDGIAVWSIGDTIIFDGTTWDKIDGITNEVISVAGLFGAITAAALKTALAYVITDIGGLAAGIATFLATPSSANLAAALTDEDGTGVVPFESSGPWTPVDASGFIVLTGASGHYNKQGKKVRAWGTFTIPANADTHTFVCGGLPFPVTNTADGGTPSPVKITNVGITGPLAVPVPNTQTFNFWNNGTTANITNAAVQGGVVFVNLTYDTP